MSEVRLYLLLGLPGAGKTTLASKLSAQTGAVHISSDEARRKLFPRSQFTQAEHDELYQKLDAAIEYLLSQGKSVIFDANLNRAVHRKEKYQLARKLKIRPVLIWVKTDKKLAKKRRVNDEPQADLVPKNESADALFERIADVFEVPSKTEKYYEIKGHDITDLAVKELLSQL